MADTDTFPDYYDILGVPRGATDVEIKRAYRKLAMMWHPDKNPDNAEAANKFQNVGEAYAVLSDLEKKAVFDQYGYEALRDGIPDDGGGVRGGFAYKQNAGEIFENFFGTSNPFSDFGFGDSVPFATRVKRPGPRKADPVVNTMACTLEELYNGCVKKHNVTRQRYTPEGVLEADTKTVTITVKPGWKKGTKVTFPCEGDEAPNTIPADVVFVLSEAPHPSFARQGNDLVYTCNISLADALTDCALAVPTLDGRTLAIPCPEVVSPPYEKAIEGEGMPVSKRPGTKGNLVIRFKIAFPTYLSQEKKLVLRSMLAGSEAPPPPAVAAADEAAE